MAESVEEMERRGDDEKRPAFGNRHLQDPSRVYEHNAWDDVEWDDEQERLAEDKVRQNSTIMMSSPDKERLESDASANWDAFYHQHQNRFFKDRHWLFIEFPELRKTQKSSASCQKFNIFEVGCGAGNTVFPILQTNPDPNLFVYCCDFADSAVKIVKEHSLYDAARCHAFQYDITATSSKPLPFPLGSIDVVIMIFVLSAIDPAKFGAVVSRLAECLRPGGVILFRDYGRYDMAQLRFKNGRCISENFYVRGDGTRVYFFTKDEVDKMFVSAGLVQRQLYIDRRLQVNRGRQIKMYRVWIQAKYMKPGD